MAALDSASAGAALIQAHLPQAHLLFSFSTMEQEESSAVLAALSAAAHLRSASGLPASVLAAGDMKPSEQLGPSKFAALLASGTASQAAAQAFLSFASSSSSSSRRPLSPLAVSATLVCSLLRRRLLF